MHWNFCVEDETGEGINDSWEDFGWYVSCYLSWIVSDLLECAMSEPPSAQRSKPSFSLPSGMGFIQDII